MGPHFFMQGLPKFESEFVIPIQNDVFKKAMKVEDILNKPLGNHHNIINGVPKNEVSYISQPICYHKDGVMLKFNFWKASDKIHADGLPFLGGYF